VYFAAGGVIHVFGRDAASPGTIKVPKGSAPNLAFGDADMKTLYVTGNEELSGPA